MDTLTVAGAIVAVVRAIKEAYPPLTGLMTIIVAAILGGLAGYIHLQGLDVVSGIIAGLTAVGAVTVADRVSSNKS